MMADNNQPKPAFPIPNIPPRYLPPKQECKYCEHGANDPLCICECHKIKVLSLTLTGKESATQEIDRELLEAYLACLISWWGGVGVKGSSPE